MLTNNRCYLTVIMVDQFQSNLELEIIDASQINK